MSLHSHHIVLIVFEQTSSKLIARLSLMEDVSEDAFFWATLELLVESFDGELVWSGKAARMAKCVVPLELGTPFIHALQACIAFSSSTLVTSSMRRE